jgi:transmembrane sensor
VRRRVVSFASLAACGLLTLGLAAPPGGMAAWFADARTSAGEVRRLTLPDGTKVVLDGGSALSWNVTSSERRVTLVGGRAFFDIADEAARPFVVETPNAEVRDIGTAFEVGLGDKDTDVAVASGIVAVTLDDGGSETLRASQMVRFGNRFDAVRGITADRVAPWRTGRLIFEDRPLGDVLGDLERYGAGRIVVLDTGIAARRLTGAFDAKAPAAALDAVLQLAGARATKVGPITFIRAK